MPLYQDYRISILGFYKILLAKENIKEGKPYYNSYALATVANMVYNDHTKSIAEDMGYKTVSEVINEKNGTVLLSEDR